MKIMKGRWKVKNGNVIEMKHDEEGYYAIVDLNNKNVVKINHDEDGNYATIGLDDSSGTRQDRMYYDGEGICYRDRRLNYLYSGEKSQFNDVRRNDGNNFIFDNWNVVECIEEIVPIKVNSNPIFMLNPCTE